MAAQPNPLPELKTASGTAGRKERVRAEAKRLGFTRVGIAPAEPWPEGQALAGWLARGYAGTMGWMAASAEKRTDPRRLMPGARAVVSVALSYRSDRPPSTAPRAPGHGWIARYAWGRDYHRVLERRLRRLSRAIQRIFPGARCAARVDTGPILEHVAAAHAGVGWIGKNTCVIDREAGSFLFLGEIVTDAALEPDRPAADHCGTCTRCIDACPTGALVEPRTLDARRCIAYLTIEHTGSIEETLRGAIGTHVFGCDICQDVCPWNRDAPPGGVADFEPRPGQEAPELGALLERILEDFEAFSRRTTLRRARQTRWLRNVAVAMGNSREPRFATALAPLADHADPVVREHARWALAKIRSAP
jgi:epoxyqueuosine reductase